MNFCVQICSDFTNFENVREFRRASEAVADGRPIDFTFLLQRNRDQFATQFVNSTGAYFAPPNAMIDTSRGCLVFANIGSESAGKSEYWGKSMLLFPWSDRHWRTYGSPTYWLHDDPANNYQAVVLREPGACLYWLRYKPHYLVLVRKRRGSKRGLSWKRPCTLSQIRLVGKKADSARARARRASPGPCV